MAASTIKACHNVAVLIFSNWHLCLVSIAHRICHSKDWFSDGIDISSVITANLHKIIGHNIILYLKLLGIANLHNLTAATGAGNLTLWLNPKLRRHYNFLQSSKTIGLFHLCDDDVANISYNCIFDKNGHTISVTNSSPFKGHIFYC